MWHVAFRFVVAAVILGVQASAAHAQLKATLYASGFTKPLGFVQDPTDPAVQMVLEQGGRIRVVRNGAVQGTDFLNIPAAFPGETFVSSGERGLLGLAFSPDYATSGRAYVSFTNQQGHSVIARFLRSTGNPLQLDPATRFDLQWPDGNRFLAHPPSLGGSFGNHNGGNIAFGPDGYLYIGLGDGGSGNDPYHLAQNPASPMGKMLRIDVSVPVNNPTGYTVPGTNPFVGQGGVMPEIWSLGWRNPWRWSFDTAGPGGTGAIVVADVGQGAYEEVDYEPAGAGGRNYGWRNREGAHDNVTSLPPFPVPLTDPVWEYGRGVGSSITGGFVYRGLALAAAYRGRYFFADFGSSRVFSIGFTFAGAEATAAWPLEHTAELGGLIAAPSSFGVDAAGELYIVNYGGSIYRIDPRPGPAPGGCATADPFASIGGGTCLAGVWFPPALPGDVNADQRNDLVFQNTTGALYSWFLNGTTLSGGGFLSQSLGGAPANITVGGMNDFTGDGKPDLIVQNQVNGSLSIHVMNGLTKIGEQPIPIASSTPWRVAATGDFNQDGFADLLWQHASTGQFFAWYLKPVGGQWSYLGGAYLQDGSAATITLGSTAWRVVGAGDVNRDARTDVLLQNQTTGELQVWYLNGVTRTLVEWLTPGAVGPQWRVRAVGDFNGDGHPDLFFEHAATGALYVWHMVGSQLVTGGFASPAQVNPIWLVVGPR